MAKVPCMPVPGAPLIELVPGTAAALAGGPGTGAGSAAAKAAAAAAAAAAAEGGAAVAPPPDPWATPAPPGMHLARMQQLLGELEVRVRLRQKNLRKKSLTECVAV